MSNQQRILSYLKRHPRKSAWQVSQTLDLDVRTVSSYLKKCADRGTLVRQKGVGPSGGYVYAHP